MSSHIGIVGVSPEGAAIFYRQLMRQAGRSLGQHQQPKISIHNEPLPMYLDAIRKDDWHGVGKLLRRSAELLYRCGADFCLTPDTAVEHGVYLAEVGSPIPWMTMADLVAQSVTNDQRKCVGLIGTKLTMFSSTYQTHLGLRGIQVLPPDDAEAEGLDRIIFGELIYGHIRPDSRLYVLQAIDRLAGRGCEAVILACSEAPLLVTADNSPLPVYDAAEILAESAVRRAGELTNPGGANAAVGSRTA